MASISAIMLSRVESRAGSMTMLSMPLMMPRSGGVGVLTLAEPTMAPANSSHTSARPEPLCSPNGNTTPRGSVYITEGSVVGWPAWSSNAPSSIGFPELCATRTFPIATRLVAKSSRIGSLLSVPGMAMQTGLVRNLPSRPRNGATGAAPKRR